MVHWKTDHSSLPLRVIHVLCKVTSLFLPHGESVSSTLWISTGFVPCFGHQSEVEVTVCQRPRILLLSPCLNSPIGTVLTSLLQDERPCMPALSQPCHPDMGEPSQGVGFSWLTAEQTHESSSQVQKCLVEPSPNFWPAMREINGCFKLLSSGVVGYPVKTNWKVG